MNIGSLAKHHYENFPVASWLLPKNQRTVVALIYAFARTADDLADEGTASPQERLAQLTLLETQLHQSIAGKPTVPWINKLAHYIHQHALPVSCFERLLVAFKQDADFKGYTSMEHLLEYCSYSANPVGELLLTLSGNLSPEHLHQSNAICTALQLINFLQDLKRDLEHGRCTLPTGNNLPQNITTLYPLIQTQYAVIQKLLDTGAPLGWTLRGRFGLQIRFTIAAAFRMLQKLKHRESVFQRPTMTPWDYGLLFPCVFGKFGFSRLGMSNPSKKHSTSSQ